MPSWRGALEVVRLPVQRGDVATPPPTPGSAFAGFGYEPQVSLREGLRRMVDGRSESDAAAAGLSA